MLDDLLQRRPYNAVTDLVDANVARGRGGKIAFTDAERSLTYGELQARTCRFAAALQTLGLRPEERMRPAALRHRRFSGRVLGRRARRRRGAAAQHAADARSNTPTSSPTAARRRWSLRPRSRETSCRSSTALPRLRTIILVGANADDKAAFAGREVHDFEDLLARAPADAVHRADAVRRGRVLDVHLGLDRRSQGRQARPHHADGGGAADGPGHHRHPRGRRGVLGGEAVLLLRHGQRHGVSDVGRRDHGAAAAPADAGGGVRAHAPPSADDLLRRADALCLAARAQGHDAAAPAPTGCGCASRPARRCRRISASAGARPPASTCSTASARPRCSRPSSATGRATSATARPASRCPATT